MTNKVDICTLDYLVGTLATAYKGMVTSLIAKEFCITKVAESTTFKGRVISIPDGDYSVVLMHSGNELARAPLREGYFEMKTRTSIIEKAKNLQLDILQSGKHIGTFLLKQETAGVLYSSALEISEELKGINFRLLNDRLSGKKGLQKKGESIIASIVSTKKDWKKLSDEINTFAKDLFWYDPEIFLIWYEILVRFSARSSQNVEKEFESKALSNLLYLIELPLDHEIDRDRLYRITKTWFLEVSAHPLNLALRHRNYTHILTAVHTKIPEFDLLEASIALLDSLNAHLKGSFYINTGVMNIFRKHLSENETITIDNYSRKKRDTIVSLLKKSKNDLKIKKDITRFLDTISGIDPSVFDSGEILRSLFGLLKRNIKCLSSNDLTTILKSISNMARHISHDVYKSALLHITQIIDQLISDNMIYHCMILLDFIGNAEDSLRDDVVFNADVASAILRSQDTALLSRYEEILKSILIPSASISGFSEQTWAEISNPLHFKRLNGFLKIVSCSPDRLKNVMIHFIANLYVSGVFIPDDKLFQRDISAYMNSVDLSVDFFHHYLLLRKLPVYFHDVGASGKIRDLTTEIDSWGNDPVIYFLRKQVHVNASNYNIGLIECIIKAWAFNNAETLKNVVPAEIYENINHSLLSRHSSAITNLFRSFGLFVDDKLTINKIIHISDEEIERKARHIETTDEIRSKITLICKIYKALINKYALTGPQDYTSDLTQCVSRLGKLKGVYTSSDKTEAKESFYFKRHIAFGIPSVIGSYHEAKFDAFGESLRIEDKARVIIENIITDIENSFDNPGINKVKTWLKSLHGIKNIFDIHGLSNPLVQEALEILNSNTLYLSQVNDLMRVWQRELTWMVEIIYRTFHKTLIKILESCSKENLPENLKRLAGEGKTFINSAADIVIRNILNSITGFEELDRLLNSLIKCIGRLTDTGQDTQISISDEPVKSKDLLTFEELSDSDALRYAPFLGNKAKNLVILFNKGLPVPYGVVFSSAHSFDYQTYIESREFINTLKEALSSIEKKTGLSLGDTKNPLFVAVRSGSFISMPGILSSILYCGMNEATLNALIENTGNPWLAWDSYRRFIEHYSTVVHSVEMNSLDKISDKILSRHSVKNVRSLDALQLKELVEEYKNYLEFQNLHIPEEPFEQVKTSISAIYRSWFEFRAIQFRKAMNVSQYWGSAVIIIPMIQANSENAGASVFFTRDPSSLDKGVYGETRRMATGDDLVYGKLSSRPISKDRVSDGGESLEQFDPELYRLHAAAAEKIEDVMGDIPQEVEAAYIQNRSGKKELYILQTKRMEFRRGYTEKFHDICKMESSIIGRGIGIHGGALSGIVTFSDSPDHIKKLKSDYSQPIILLRNETSTDDVALMQEIDGIITSVGGATSHAAILAQKFDLTAVVGCSDMTIKTDDQGSKYSLIGDFSVREGESVSIDGSSGIVYSGVCLLTVKEENY